MRLLKLSLATIMAMGTMSYAADSLSDAFKEGKLQGELKAYYYDRNWKGNTNVGAVNGNIVVLGAKLDYETAPLYNFKLGLGFQSSNTPWADKDGKEAYGTAAGPGTQDMWASGAVLSQAYIAYTIGKTTLKVGRQYIDMPLIGSAPSRLIVESFQGASIVNTDLPDTTLMAAYVNKFQGWTDGAGHVAGYGNSMNGMVLDNAYAIAAINKSLSNTTITAAYGAFNSDNSANNDYNMLYLDAVYAGKASDFTYTLAAQYGNVNYDASTSSDSNFYGVKAGFGIAGFNTYIAYVDIQDGNSIWGVAGSGTKPLIYTSTAVFAGDFSQSKQYAIDANYMIKPLDLVIGARYVNVDYKGVAMAGDKADITSIYAGTTFGGVLKGLDAAIAYEDENHDVNSNDKKELWFRGSYKF